MVTPIAVVAPVVVAPRFRTALPYRLRPQKLRSWRCPALPNDEVLNGAYNLNRCLSIMFPCRIYDLQLDLIVRAIFRIIT
jgi:hypothetical protein